MIYGIAVLVSADAVPAQEKEAALTTQSFKLPCNMNSEM